MPEYAVVAFDGTNDVAVIHSSWKTDVGGRQHCYWPKTDPTTKARIGKKPALDGAWSLYAIKVLSECDDWNLIIERLKRSENTSNLDSDILDARDLPVKRLIKKPKRDSFESSYEETVSRKELPIVGSNQNKLPDWLRTAKSDPKQSDSSISDIPVKRLMKKRMRDSYESSYEDTVSRKELPIVSSNPHKLQDRKTVKSNPKQSDMSVFSATETAGPCTSSSIEPKGVPNLATSQSVTNMRLLEHIIEVKEHVVEVKEHVAEVKGMLGQVLLKDSPQPRYENENTVLVEDIIPSPLNTHDEFLEFEEKLAGSQRLRTELKTALRSVGGTDVSDSIRKMLRKVASNGVLSMYCCQGRSKTKLPMNNLKVYKVLFRACRFVHPSVTETKYKISLGNALRHAPYQKGGSHWKGKTVDESVDETALDSSSGDDDQADATV